MSARLTRRVRFQSCVLVIGAVLAGPPAAAATQLTSGSFSVVDFEWSPDDQTIALTEVTGNGTSRLVRVPASGGPVTVLGADGGDYSTPHWSADGALILTSFLDGGNRTICAVSASSGSCVFQNPNPGRFAPRFGPSRSPTQVVGSTADADSIVVMDLTTGTETTLTSSSLGLFRPHWNSSARGIVFDAAGSNSFMQAQSIPGGGGPISELTDCSCDVCMEDVDPATGALAYAAGVVDEQGENQLFVLEGSGPSATLNQLTSGPVNRSSPVWTPFGSHLVYDRLDPSGDLNVFMIPRTGGTEIQLTSGPDMKRLGKVSHDRTRVAYLQADPDPQEEMVWHLYVSVIPQGTIPTLPEWGLIIMALMLLTIGTIVLRSGQVAAAGAGSASITMAARPRLFVSDVFAKVLVAALGLMIIALVSASRFFASPSATDVVGTLISVVIASYLVHLWIVQARER